MTFLEDLKASWENLKDRFGVSWQKLVTQLPDPDRRDDYYWDDSAGVWVLKSTLLDSDKFVLDDDKNLKVSLTNNKVFTDTLDGIQVQLYEELDFLADGITIICFDVEGSSNNIYIEYMDPTNVQNSIGLYQKTTFSSQFVAHVDCKPYNYFYLNLDGVSDGFQYTIIFHKQKKTKISDTTYASSWDAVVDIGASKNAIYDKLVLMIAEYVALISDTAYNESTWNNVTTIAPSKNAVRDKIVSMIAEYVALISDIAYNASTWDAVTTIAPSKNAVRDKIESMISDTIYSSLWDAITTIAPSKNAVYDEIENVKKSILALTLFLHQNASADIENYRMMCTIYPDDSKTEIFNVTVSADNQEIEQFATPVGCPELTYLMHGIYYLHFHTYKFSGTKNVSLYYKVYKRASNDAETLLGESVHSSLLTGAEAMYDIHCLIEEVPLVITDRIVLKIFAHLEGEGTDAVVYFYIEGDTLARFNLPISLNLANSDITYNASTWDANLSAPTKNVIRDWIQAHLTPNIHHTPTVAGDLNHNSLANLNAGTDYEHITQAQKDALHGIATLNEYYFAINGGVGGAVEITGIGASYVVAFSDISAYFEANGHIIDGGDFKVSIVHVGSGANNGKTASGLLYVSYDVADGTDAWDIDGVNMDLTIDNANILKIQEYATPFTVADNSKIGLAWGKDDNAENGAGNMFVYGFILKRV